jgi:hypothetical protein
MRQSIGIAAVIAVAVAGLWGWTVSNGGANAQAKLALARGIDTLAVTMAAPAMPSQQFDAH